MNENDNEEHRLRARLVVKGYVQGVGYRNIVMRIARTMDVLGIIKNIDNGDVEIFCKCKNLKHLDEFIEKIKIISDPNDIYSPNVKNIERYTEPKDIDSFNPPKEFGLFNIDYGNISQHEKDMLIKMDTGSRIMLNTSEGVKNMHRDMVQSFDKLDQKYDSFGKQFCSVHDDLKNMNNYFKILVEHVIATGKTKKK